MKIKVKSPFYLIVGSLGGVLVIYHVYLYISVLFFNYSMNNYNISCIYFLVMIPLIWLKSSVQHSQDFICGALIIDASWLPKLRKIFYTFLVILIAHMVFTFSVCPTTKNDKFFFITLVYLMFLFSLMIMFGFLFGTYSIVTKKYVDNFWWPLEKIMNFIDKIKNKLK